MAGVAAADKFATVVTTPVDVFTVATVVDDAKEGEVTCIPAVTFEIQDCTNVSVALPATMAFVGIDRPTSSEDGFTQSTCVPARMPDPATVMPW